MAGALFGLLMLDEHGLLSGFLERADAAEASLASGDDGVSVTTDKLRYQLGETIIVQVTNQLESVITTRDQRSQCTIIALERLSKSEAEWTEVRDCFSGAPPSDVTLQPGSRTTIRLEFGSSPSGGLAPGHYRAALEYSRGDKFSAAPGNLLVARSDQFQIE